MDDFFAKDRDFWLRMARAVVIGALAGAATLACSGRAATSGKAAAALFDGVEGAGELQWSPTAPKGSRRFR